MDLLDYKDVAVNYDRYLDDLLNVALFGFIGRSNSI